MKAAFYAGASGLSATQQAMDTIGNNIANVNTTGYQASRVSFASLLNGQMYVNAPDEPLTGFGVKAVDTGYKIGQGGIRATSFALDFGIKGNAFFAVENNEQIEYTRDGTFNIMMMDDGAYLGTQNGAYVLDKDGEKIELEMDEEKGAYKLDTLIEEIGLYTFTNPSALSGVSGNRFLPTEQSGEAVVDEDDISEVVQGVLENSGTIVADEMANMITIQRAFQLSSRVIQVADENEQTINNLRK